MTVIIISHRSLPDRLTTTRRMASELKDMTVIMPIHFPENVISCIFFASNFEAPQLLLCHFLRFSDIIDILDESLANAEMVAIAGLSSQTFITYLLFLRVKHMS